MTDGMVNQLVAAAAHMALPFVGVPYEQMLVALYTVREDMKMRLAGDMPAAIATLVAEAFVTAVAGHKAELEAAANHRETLQ
jgi:hypothetical protein